jgi:hypothetical protein
MKRYNHVAYTSSTAIAISLLTAAVLTLAACHDDDSWSKPVVVNGKVISFSAGIDNGTTLSRSGANYRFSSYNSEALTDGEHYLITTVEDGIDSPYLTADDAAEMASRGMPITTANRSFTSFPIYAYVYDKDSYSSYTAAGEHFDTAEYINGEMLTETSSGQWEPETPIYWTTADRMVSFFAIYPSMEQYTDIISAAGDVSDADAYTIDTDEGVPPHIDYMVYQTPVQEPDILFAQTYCTGDGSTGLTNGKVMFQFKHLLTAVKVKIGTGFTGSTIKKVEFQNIKRGGRYYFGNDEWYNLDELSSCYMERDMAVTADNQDYTDTDTENAANGQNVFMMMPQDLDQTSLICVTIADSDGATHTYSATLKNTKWEMGKTVTYTLSRDPDLTVYKFEFPVNNVYFSWRGDRAGDAPTVYSYSLTYSDSSSDPTISPVSYYIANTSTDIVDPDGLIDLTNTDTASGTGTQTSDAVYYSFNVNGTKIPDNMVEELTANDEKRLQANAGTTMGSESSYLDLSLYRADGSPYVGTGGAATPARNTANCYIVNYPGYYMIPVTIGNAIANDATVTNSSSGNAVKTGVSDTYAINNLVDLYGSGIQGGWIPDGLTYWSRYKPSFANVFWQDADDLITDVELYNKQGNEYYIKFRVGKTNFTQGNAVLAAHNTYNNGDICWSYHIWVTPYKYSDTFTADANPLLGSEQQVTFLQVPLGYVEEPIRHYKPRNATVTLTQSGSGRRITLNLIQEEHTFQPRSCCYYQWGRKDPFPGVLATEDGTINEYRSYIFSYKVKSVSGYDISNGYSGNSSDNIKNSIQHPDWFFVGEYWEPNFYIDLWGCRSNSTLTSGYGGMTSTNSYSSIKTVYDPCPYGFRVPAIMEFPAMTYNGDKMDIRDSWSATSPLPETELFVNRTNTPYTSHIQAVENFGFYFYKTKMTGQGESCKVPGDPEEGRYFLPAMGKIPGNGKDNGGRIHDLGQYFFYWSSTHLSFGTSAVSQQAYYVQGGYAVGVASVYNWQRNTNTAEGFPILALME